MGPDSAKHGADLGPPDGEKSSPTERTVGEAEAKRHSHTGHIMMKNPPASEGDNNQTGRGLRI